MLIDMRRRSSVDVLRLNGPLKLNNGVEEFRQTLEELTSGGSSQIVLNLSEVPMIDSTGIGALVRFHTVLRQQGGAIKLVSPSKFALLCLRTVGVLRLFDLYDEEDSAVESFSA